MSALYPPLTILPTCQQMFFPPDQLVFSELVQRMISDFSLEIYYCVCKKKREICFFFQRNKLEKNEL